MTELDRLHRRAMFLCDFLENHFNDERIFDHKQRRASLERAYREKNLRGYRMVARDNDAWVYGWDDAALRDELNRRWKEGPGAGEPPFGGKPRELRSIQRRGKIRNAEEYRMVRDYLSDFECDGKTAVKLEAMLSAYTEAGGDLEDS